MSLRYIQDLEAEVVDLRGALAEMVEHDVGYMKTNLLGDPEKQHRIRRARAALAKTEGRASELEAENDELRRKIAAMQVEILRLRASGGIYPPNHDDYLRP